MTFDLFTTLPMYMALFWAVIFVSEFKKNNYAKRVFTFFLVATSIIYFCHAIYYNKYYDLYSKIESLYIFSHLAVYPLYYLYIRALTEPRKLKFKDLWILSPAVILSILTFVLYLFMDNSQKIDFVESSFYTKEVHKSLTLIDTLQVYRVTFVKIVFSVQIILVIIYGLKKLHRYEKKISNYFANVEKITLSRINKVFVLFIVISSISALVNILGREFYLNKPELLAIPSIGFSVFIFALCYISFKQDYSAFDLEKEIAGSDEIEVCSSDCKDEYIQHIDKLFGEELKTVIEQEKIFTKTDLRISDIAQKVGSNRSYVSNYINQVYHVSFSDYINSYRVEYAQTLIKEKGSSIKFSEISELSGFSNESSFYRNFKKITGQTPAQWVKSIR